VRQEDTFKKYCIWKGPAESGLTWRFLTLEENGVKKSIRRNVWTSFLCKGGDKTEIYHMRDFFLGRKKKKLSGEGGCEQP